MGYRVKKVKRQKGPQFKVQYEWFDGGVHKTREIPKDDWIKYGFRFDMSLEQAKLQLKTLNAQEKITSAQKRKQKAQARIDESRLAEVAYFPTHYVTEFEFLKLGESKKALVYWKKAREIIVELKLPFREWEPKKELFYRYFLNNNMSPAYVQKVLPLINRWGYFFADKTDKAFRPIPAPPRQWARQLTKAHNRKVNGRGNRKSAPLKPAMLYPTDKVLTQEEYRWLYLSMWFGLRPGEVDLLTRPSGPFTWKMRQVGDEKRLYVFQPKLEGDEDNEWKFIPAKQKEQIDGLQFVGKPLERPRRKDMIKHFGKDVTLYGGRQGFVKLMKYFQEDYVSISHWLGHTELDRTYKDYTKRLEEDYTDDDVRPKKSA